MENEEKKSPNELRILLYSKKNNNSPLNKLIELEESIYNKYYKEKDIKDINHLIHSYTKSSLENLKNISKHTDLKKVFISITNEEYLKKNNGII